MPSFIIYFPETNNENLPEINENDSFSNSKVSIFNNDDFPSTSTKFLNNSETFSNNEKDICKHSSDSHDVSILKSDHNNDLKRNKKNDFLERDRPTSSIREGWPIFSLL